MPGGVGGDRPSNLVAPIPISPEGRHVLVDGWLVLRSDLTGAKQ